MINQNYNVDLLVVALMRKPNSSAGKFARIILDHAKSKSNGKSTNR